MKEETNRRLDRFCFVASRFFIRSFRICSGVVVALISIWMFSGASDVAEIQFSAMSLKLVGTFVFDVTVGILLIVWAWVLAFGPPPHDAIT